jgi:hypothetical protein
MGLDIKIPIGLMFAIFGILLTIFGLTTNNSEMYQLSLGININLFSGIFMIFFGAFMLILSVKTKNKKRNE